MDGVVIGPETIRRGDVVRLDISDDSAISDMRQVVCLRVNRIQRANDSNILFYGQVRETLLWFDSFLKYRRTEIPRSRCGPALPLRRSTLS